MNPRPEDYPGWPPEDEYMCPNCVTPWKCNGPHEPEGMMGVYAEKDPQAERDARPSPYIPQDVGSEDYAAILETARKITTEHRWLKEQNEYLTYQLKLALEEEKALTEEIKKLRTYIPHPFDGGIKEDPA